jgi:hypothetical protein
VSPPGSAARRLAHRVTPERCSNRSKIAGTGDFNGDHKSDIL